jgi:rhodanese-related sulfurtransferase
MSEVENKIIEAKETLTNPIPTPPAQQTPISSPKALKERLEWGEPALTIIDIRERDLFNEEHITGAMPMPLTDVVEMVSNSLEHNRDIYLYGSDNEQAAEAATKLGEAGFTNVSQIEGGLDAWKAIAGPTDGRVS